MSNIRPLLYRGKVIFALALALPCAQAAVTIPGGSLSVSGTTSTGSSFAATGTVTQNDTISLTVTGTPCLQGPVDEPTAKSGSRAAAGGYTYCTNAAGVVITPGSSAVGAATSFSGGFGGTFQSWTYGALVMTVEGVGSVQVFPATAANGLGSSTPPSTLTITNRSLASLGFPAFSVANPTITFRMADSGYTDNSGSFSIAQPAGPPPVPAPSSLLLLASALAGITGVYFYRQRQAAN